MLSCTVSYVRKRMLHSMLLRLSAMGTKFKKINLPEKKPDEETNDTFKVKFSCLPGALSQGK